MKPFLLGVVIGVGAAAVALQPKIATTFLDQIYPLDAAKRQALDLCMLEDPNFNRLAPSAREACYRHQLSVPVLAAARATTGVAPNQVDIGQAVAWGGAPRNDVRVIEASQGFDPRVADNPSR
jgi:hypothetical protein